jgi:hypothetical protein
MPRAPGRGRRTRRAAPAQEELERRAVERLGVLVQAGVRQRIDVLRPAGVRGVLRRVFEYERTVDGDAVKADVRPPPA